MSQGKLPAPRCTAKSKRTGVQCGHYPPPGSGSDKCRYHGGLSPIKHGLYSKFSKGRLGQRIQELQNDPSLTKLEPILAVTQALLESQLEAYGPYLAAIENPEGIPELKPLPPDQIDALRKLAETAGKMVSLRTAHMRQAENMVPVEVFAILLDKFVAAINQHVQDERVRTALLGTLREAENLSITSRTH